MSFCLHRIDELRKDPRKSSRFMTRSKVVFGGTHYNAKTQNHAIYSNIRVVKRFNSHCITRLHNYIILHNIALSYITMSQIERILYVLKGKPNTPSVLNIKKLFIHFYEQSQRFMLSK